MNYVSAWQSEKCGEENLGWCLCFFCQYAWKEFESDKPTVAMTFVLRFQVKSILGRGILKRLVLGRLVFLRFL